MGTGGEKRKSGSSKNAASSKNGGNYTAIHNICNQIEGLKGGRQEKGLGAWSARYGRSEVWI